MTEEKEVGFSELGLSPAVLKAVRDIGYEVPSPIQARSIPPLVEGADLLGQAQTGTGKTAAFSLPLLSRIDTCLKVPQILVLTPTRELALQVAEAMQTYARNLKGFQVLPVYGGQNMVQQLRQLQRGVQAVVGTPGRILDHLRRGTLKLDSLVSVVLDEADEMLKMGFVDDVETIIEHAPKERQMALFSATMPKEVLEIARRHLKDPVEIRIKNKTSTVETISQRFWQVKGLHKLDALTRILEAEEIDAMIVFVRTKTATVELSEKLEARGFASAPLNGDMTQVQREKTIERFKNGGLDIIVATDVAARGLDVQRVSHVINYEIPYDTEAYVHRIGRTGRAGREGKAILFVAPREMRMLYAIEQATRQKITPMTLPSRKDITDLRVGLFKEQICETLESQELEFFEELIDSTQAEYDVGLRRIAAALAFMAQQGKPLQLSEKQEAPLDPEDLLPAKGSRKKGRDDSFESYRIEVGRMHGVEPRHIVGSITNEANIPSRHIGQIRIFEDHSLVDLPPGMPSDILKHLRAVWVCGEQLKIAPLGGKGPSRPAKGVPRRSGARVGEKKGSRSGNKKHSHHRRGPRE